MNIKKPREKKNLINEEIKYPFVLLIDENKTSTKMRIEEALDLAKLSNKDLILINNSSEIPIVKIFEHGKFLYSQKRKLKGAKKNVIKTKSITVKPKIDAHDLSWKANQAIDWFKLGDSVQFIIRATGRMTLKTDLIDAVYKKFTELVAQYAEPRGELKQSGKIQFETYFFPIKKSLN